MTDTYVRTQVEIKIREEDLAADWVTHVVWHHHSDESGTLGPFDPDGHARNVNEVFQHGTGTSGTPFNTYANQMITTKVYNMDQAKPRPILGEYVFNPVTYNSLELGPRELAVPLRYYATRNLKKLRGRLFIGPWIQADVHETVNTTQFDQLLDLGTALGAIGGAQMSWCMHSETDDVLNAPGNPGGTTKSAWHDITYVWVNDQWAHMKSREKDELGRWGRAITPGLP